jgi:fatty-acyl-CoA synthase
LRRNDWACIKVDADTEEPFRGRNGLCQETALGEPGELVWRIRDISQVPGYYKDFKATSKKFLPNVRRGGDLWFRSGDLLTRGEDGCWYFIDRLGDTFRWKSENVSTMVSPLSPCDYASRGPISELQKTVLICGCVH